MEAMLLLLPSGPLCSLGVSAQHEFHDNPTIFQVLTCPRGLASGVVQAACTLSCSLSHTRAPSAVPRRGHVTWTVPFQLQLTQGSQGSQTLLTSQTHGLPVLTLKGSRGNATGLLPAFPPQPRSPAYLFDGTLEAGLLVLHPVDLSEGASAQAGLARGPVDVLSVLIIHRLEFLGLAGDRGRFQWPGQWRDEGLQ